MCIRDRIIPEGKLSYPMLKESTARLLRGQKNRKCLKSLGAEEPLAQGMAGKLWFLANGEGVDWELWRIYLGDIGDLQKCLQYCKRDEYCDHEHEPHKEVSPFIHG